MCGKLKLGTVSRKGLSIWSTYTLPFFASLNVVCIIEEWERSLFTTTVYHHCFLLKKQKAAAASKVNGSKSCFGIEILFLLPLLPFYSGLIQFYRQSRLSANGAYPYTFQDIFKRVSVFTEYLFSSIEIIC